MEKRKKRKKKNKLWILQSVLCAVCMFSAALLYYDYVKCYNKVVTEVANKI